MLIVECIVAFNMEHDYRMGTAKTGRSQKLTLFEARKGSKMELEQLQLKD